MKKLRMILSLAVVGIAIAGSAFTTHKAIHRKTSTSMYLYLESSDQPSVFRQSINWRKVEIAPVCLADVDIPCYVIYSGTNFTSFISTAMLKDTNAIAGSKKSKQ